MFKNCTKTNVFAQLNVIFNHINFTALIKTKAANCL